MVSQRTRGTKASSYSYAVSSEEASLAGDVEKFGQILKRVPKDRRCLILPLLDSLGQVNSMEVRFRTGRPTSFPMSVRLIEGPYQVTWQFDSAKIPEPALP
jgi:hypothetical protein